MLGVPHGGLDGEIARSLLRSRLGVRLGGWFRWAWFPIFSPPYLALAVAVAVAWAGCVALRGQARLLALPALLIGLFAALLSLTLQGLAALTPPHMLLDVLATALLIVGYRVGGVIELVRTRNPAAVRLLVIRGIVAGPGPEQRRLAAADHRASGLEADRRLHRDPGAAHPRQAGDDLGGATPSRTAAHTCATSASVRSGCSGSAMMRADRSSLTGRAAPSWAWA